MNLPNITERGARGFTAKMFTVSELLTSNMLLLFIVLWEIHVEMAHNVGTKVLHEDCHEYDIRCLKTV